MKRNKLLWLALAGLTLFVGSSALKQAGVIEQDATDVIVDVFNGDESTDQPAG